MFEFRFTVQNDNEHLTAIYLLWKATSLNSTELAESSTFLNGAPFDQNTVCKILSELYFCFNQYNITGKCIALCNTIYCPVGHLISIFGTPIITTYPPLAIRNSANTPVSNPPPVTRIEYNQDHFDSTSHLATTQQQYAYSPILQTLLPINLNHTEFPTPAKQYPTLYHVVNPAPTTSIPSPATHITAKNMPPPISNTSTNKRRPTAPVDTLKLRVKNNKANKSANTERKTKTITTSSREKKDKSNRSNNLLASNVKYDLGKVYQYTVKKETNTTSSENFVKIDTTSEMTNDSRNTMLTASTIDSFMKKLNQEILNDPSIYPKNTSTYQSSFFFIHQSTPPSSVKKAGADETKENTNMSSSNLLELNSSTKK